jgi:exodeoxyribonuclease VII large subunit
MSHRLERLRINAQRLSRQHPRRRLRDDGTRLLTQRQSLQAGLARRLEHRALHLGGLARALHAVSPLATIARGYAILTEPDSGRVLRTTRAAHPGQPLRAQLADGRLALKVEQIEPATPDPGWS